MDSDSDSSENEDFFDLDLWCFDTTTAERLIKTGAYVNARDKRSRTALMKCKSRAISELLIKNGADVNACDASGRTALMMCESTTIAELLIKNGADVNACDESGRTALMMCKFPYIAELLINNGADVNACDESGRTALMMCESTTNVYYLIMDGADVNGCDASERTAVKTWKSSVIAEVLIKNGADVNACDASGNTVFIMHGSPEFAELLIKNGADVNACDASGRTPLMMCKFSFFALLMIKNGAEVNATDASGRTALMMCKSTFDADCLIKKGADVNACDASGRTVLMLCESVFIAELLIKNGADVNHTIHDENNRQLSVLSEMLSRSISVSQILLRHGAQVNADDLIYLMSNSQLTASNPISREIFDQVLSSGANVNARDGYGLTPLMLCRHILFAEKLLEKGADIHATCIINSKEMSALSFAIKNRCIDVRDVLSTSGTVAQPEDLLKALQYYSSDKTLALLLSSCRRKRKFINMRDEEGKTPLMLCKSLDSVRMLLELGADVNARISDETNVTVLIERIMKGQVDLTIVLALLEAGADVNATCIINSKEMSALSFAFQHRCMNSIDVLLTHGAVAQPEDLLLALQYHCDDKTLALLLFSCRRKKEFINMRDEDGKTPLMLCRSLNSVRMLLELGADVNARISDETNITVLMEMIRAGHVDRSIVQALLEAGADVSATCIIDSKEMSALFFVCKNRRMDLIDDLVSYRAVAVAQPEDLLIALQCDLNDTTLGHLISSCPRKNEFINMRDEGGKTPLMLCRTVESVRMLLELGADVNARISDETNVTVHMEMIRSGHMNRKILIALLEAGADVNATCIIDSKEMSALSFACKNRRMGLIDVLLFYRAEAQPEDLLIALQCDFYDTTLALLISLCPRKNEFINMRDEDGKTPLMLCRTVESVRMLLELGADVNARISDETNITVLIEMIRAGHVDQSIVLALLEAGADVNATCIIDSKEMSALSFACKNRHTSVIDILVTHGAVAQPEDFLIALQYYFNDTTLGHLISSSPRKNEFINMRDEDGKTALMRCRTVESVRMLLELGADVNARISDETNVTVLIERIRAIHVDRSIMLALLEAGADVNAICIINKKVMSALSFACKDRRMDLIDVLLKHGAVAQPEDLLTALQYHCDDKTLTLLISSCPRKKEFINMRDEDGKTPLMLCKTLDSVRMLLELGADVNARISDESTNNLTVLMNTVQYNLDDRVVRVLLEAGADVNAISCSDSSAMSLLMEWAFDSPSAVLTHAWSDCVRLLFKHGAKITKNYEPAFILMIQTANLGPMELFVTNGAAPVSFRIYSKQVGNYIEKSQLYSILSPCCMALLYKNVKLARYFREINFLILSDVSLMPKTLKTMDLDEEVHSYIDEMLHHPLSLFRLSFIAISALVGPAPGREERVQGLGIPPSLQRKLLFQDLSVKLTE